MPDRTGDHLGNYRLVRLLGQGGFAEVYLGEHMHLDTQAAIKLLHTQLAGEDTDAFRNEARTIARLVHPHIVRVFDFGIEGETPFLVMDYAPNGTVRKRHPKGVALPLPTILSYIEQVADALQYAHDEHFIHRDVKPENLLVGRRQEVLLSDFGIALITQTSRSQSMQDVAGTARYMAPEQFQGKPRPASDQYALAVMVYEWLTGACPFSGSFTELASQHLFVPPPPLHERVSDIPLAVEQVVMIALAKEPKQRFGSVQAFAKAFEQASQVEEARVKAQLKEQARKAEEAEQARKAEEKLAREAEEKRIRKVEEERVKAQLKKLAREAEEAEQARKAEEERTRLPVPAWVKCSFGHENPAGEAFCSECGEPLLFEREQVRKAAEDQARSQPPYRYTAEGLSQSGFPPPKMGPLAQQYENGLYGSNYPTQQPGTWDAPAQDPWGLSYENGLYAGTWDAPAQDPWGLSQANVFVSPSATPFVEETKEDKEDFGSTQVGCLISFLAFHGIIAPIFMGILFQSWWIFVGVFLGQNILTFFLSLPAYDGKRLSSPLSILIALPSEITWSVVVWMNYVNSHMLWLTIFLILILLMNLVVPSTINEI